MIIIIKNNNFNSNLAQIYQVKSEIPYFITGFVNTEGSFINKIWKYSSLNTGWRIQLVFVITLHSKDLSILNFIQDFFGDMWKILGHFR